jgi:glycine/D-amino acid oxidase-like deaminating enzyme
MAPRILPEKVRTVIVGAGVAGVSLAHHLALRTRGAEQVLVVDRGSLFDTGGSTS